MMYFISHYVQIKLKKQKNIIIRVDALYPTTFR